MMNESRSRKSAVLPVIAGTTVFAGMALVLGWAAYMRRYIRHDLPLTSALDGDLRAFDTNAGRVAYYASLNPSDKKTAPLVLIHSINAAASAYEMKPLFDHYAPTRRVYALDLPGYGFSDRPDRAYSPQLFAEVILDFINSQLKGQPADVAALSLGCEFVALAAKVRPKLFRSITFISPTGLGQTASRARGRDDLLRLYRRPEWSQILYDTIASRPSIQYFLQLSRASRVEEELVDYAYVTSHQPGAKNAPFHFLAGKLFSRDMPKIYRSLPMPVLMAYAKDWATTYNQIGRLRKSANIRLRDFSEGSKGLIQYDNLPGLVAEMDQILDK